MTMSVADAPVKTVATSPSSRLRVLHVVASLRPGGMERALVRLLASIAQDPEAQTMQHAVAILGEADPDLARECAAHARVFRLRGKSRWGIAAYWLRRVVRTFDAQIIHARGTATWCDATLATAGINDVRRTLGFHGREHLDTPSWRRRLMMAWAASKANAIVTLSQESADWVCRNTRTPRSRMTVLPNGVDIGRFAPATPAQRSEARQRWLQPGERFLGVCVANLLPIKRIDVLLEAWRRVLMVTPDARLVIAGEGPQRSELEKRIDSLRLKQRVSLTGSQIDVRPLLCAADLFVLPSDYECCSNALLEAMASGLPCIATHGGGNPEIIEPHASGWLVPPGNSAAMADVILAALLNADARDRVGQRARASILEHHRLDQMTRQYRELYVRLNRDDAHEPLLDEELCPCAV